VPIDPDVRAFLDAANAAGLFPTVGDPRFVRTRYNGVPVPAMDGVWRIENVDIPSGAGSIRARVYSPDDRPVLPAVILFHGGGWVIGDLMMAEAQSRQIAIRAECRVVSVDYRLAPEHRYPAAADDAYRALEFFAAEAKHFGIDADELAVYGQSAGGNLAAVVSLMTRDRGGPEIALQVPVYPVIDADFSRPSYREWGDGPGLTREQMEWFWDHYVGDGDRCDPYISPIHAVSLAGVAPALVITAEADPLCSEGRAYADRLRADGVPVTYSEYPGMHHGFIGLTQLFPKAEQALAEVVRALRAAFGTNPAGDVPQP